MVKLGMVSLASRLFKTKFMCCSIGKFKFDKSFENLIVHKFISMKFMHRLLQLQVAKKLFLAG